MVAEASDRLLAEAIEKIFAAFGGIRVALPGRSQVFVKPNAANFAPYASTSPQVLSATLAYLRDHGYDQLRVMDSSGPGLFTRLVFHALGYDRICKRFGARPIYLDERRTMSIALDGGSEPVDIPRLLYEEFIVRKGQNSYLSLPKLKTHEMTTVSLNLKGQQAFVRDRDRGRDHNRRLHFHLVNLYRLMKPDFAIVDGLLALSHGHHPPAAFRHQCQVHTNVLIGGQDALAVDAVGSHILGYTTDEVEHLKLATEAGLGTADLKRIQIIGDVSRFTAKLPHQLLGRLPTDVEIVEGREQACMEGCKGSVLWALELLHNDFGGHGGFSVVFGQGLDRTRLEGLKGDILLVGRCAIAEAQSVLHDLYPDRRIYVVQEHYNPTGLTIQLCRLMGISPSRLIPLTRLKATWLLWQAKLNGLDTAFPFLGDN